MKNKIVFVLFLIFLNHFEAVCQSDPISISVTSSQCGMSDGSITLTASPEIVSQFPMPYIVDIRDIEGGTETYHMMNVTPFILNNVEPDNYLVTVWLYQEAGCKVTFNVNVLEIGLPIEASINFNCNTACIDLLLLNGTAPYEIRWMKKIGNTFELLSGWPKFDITGQDASEDLCSLQGDGIYKVTIYDAVCGNQEKELNVSLCTCLQAELINFHNVSRCADSEPDVTHPDPPTETCDGMLAISVTGGASNYTAKWSNGQTGLSISNLCTGSYSVTVTSNNCTVIKKFDICCCDYQKFKAGPPPFLICHEGSTAPLTIAGLVTNPSTTTSYDGNIFPNITGGSSLKIYKWTGPNGFTSTLKNISGLGVGTYTLTVSDGCEIAQKSFTLVSCDSINFSITSKIINACTGQSNGEISITTPSNIVVLWNIYPTAYGPELKNLAPGNYCAVLIDINTRCSKQLCFQVEEAESLSVQVINTTPSCINSNTGTVQITFNNNRQPMYFYFLSNILTNEILETGNIQNTGENTIPVLYSKIKAGIYKAIVFSRCGGSQSEEFTIENYSIDAVVETSIGCGNTSSISITTTGSNPPFSYHWDHGLFPVSSQSNLARGVYNVTIADAKGCQIIKNIADLKPSIEILEQTKACKGLWDGSVVLKINNPTNNNVGLYYGYGPNCDDCANFEIIVPDPTANPIIFELNDLSGKEQYTIQIDVNGCFEEFKFIVGEEPVQKEFNTFKDLGEDKILCIFDEICKDNRWEKNIEEPADLKAEKDKCDGLAAGLFGAFSDCGENHFFCGDSLVHRKEVGTVTLRNGEWIAWMMAATLNYENNNTLGDYCSYITVCENMPDCLNGGGRNSFWGGHMVDKKDLGNGCFRIICKSDYFFIPAPDYTICGLDFLPDYIPFTYQPTFPETECKRVTKKYGELTAQLNFLKQEYGQDFLESSLYAELSSHENDLRANCADVTYCICNTDNCDDKYEYISSNIDEIECGPIEPPFSDGINIVDATCSVNGNLNGSGEVVAWCSKYCPPNPRYFVDCPLVPRLLNIYDPTKIDLFRFSDDSKNVAIIPHTIGDVNFERFSKTKYEFNQIVSNGIFKTKGKSFFHWMDINNWEIKPQFAADFTLQNMVTKRAISLIKKDNSYTLLSTYNSKGPIRKAENLVYDDVFNVLNLQEYYGNYIITCEIKGSVSTSNKSLLHTCQSLEIIHLIVNDNLQIIDKITITGNITNTEYIISNDKSTYFILYPEGFIGTGSSQVFNRSSDVMIVKVLDNFDGTTTASDALSWSGENRLLKVERNIATNSISYIIKGNGGITLGTKYIPISQTSKLYIINEKSNDLNYSKSIDLVNNDNISNVSLTTNFDGNIFVGLTFKDSLVSSDFAIKSKGGDDICIINYDNTGNFMGVKQYGTPDDEVLKDMYWDSDILHLGGDIKGYTQVRNIGELNFFKFTPTLSTAFISVTGANDFDQSLKPDELVQRSKNEESFTLHPNPAGGYLEVSLRDALTSNMKVSIESMSGQHVFNTILTPNTINNSKFALNISNLSSGMYLLKVFNKDSSLGSKKFIKI